jgi:transposase
MPRKTKPQPAQAPQQAQAKHPGGRPTKYDPAMCEIVIQCGAEGKTLVGMADALNIHRDTLHEWRKSNPEFSDAIRFGLMKSQAWWEEKGRIATFGEVQGFSATAYIFQMKNRFAEDWRDTVKQEITGADGGAIKQQHEGFLDLNLSALSDEELATARALIQKALENEPQ